MSVASRKLIFLLIFLSAAGLFLIRCHKSTSGSDKNSSLLGLGCPLCTLEYKISITVTDATTRRTGGCATREGDANAAYDGCIFKNSPVGTTIGALLTFGATGDGSTLTVTFADKSRDSAYTALDALSTSAGDIDDCWNIPGIPADHTTPPQLGSTTANCFGDTIDLSGDFWVDENNISHFDGVAYSMGVATQVEPWTNDSANATWGYVASNSPLYLDQPKYGGWGKRIEFTMHLDIDGTAILPTSWFQYKDRDPDKTVVRKCWNTCLRTVIDSSRPPPEFSNVSDWFDLFSYCNPAFLSPDEGTELGKNPGEFPFCRFCTDLTGDTHGGVTVGYPGSTHPDTRGNSTPYHECNRHCSEDGHGLPSPCCVGPNVPCDKDAPGTDCALDPVCKADCEAVKVACVIACGTDTTCVENCNADLIVCESVCDLALPLCNAYDLAHCTRSGLPTPCQQFRAGGSTHCIYGGTTPLWNSSQGPGRYLVGASPSFSTSDYDCAKSIPLPSNTPNDPEDFLVPYACDVFAEDCAADDVYILFSIDSASPLGATNVPLPGPNRRRIDQKNLTQEEVSLPFPGI